MMALLLLAIATPLLCALLALFEGLRNKLLFTLPWATFPALLLALTLNENLIISLPYGLTGVLLGMDEIRRIFLILAVLLWTVAGVYAIGYLQRDTRHWQFALCWLLTLSGNLGLILSFDALSFYSFFALMTFAGYGLVVHTASDEAFYAGRIYLIMAVIGEGLLLIGLLSAVFVAGVNADLNLLPTAIANAQFPLLISLFIFLGFGIKAGLPIFHLWLPLAHPVAPVPASAVLSGVMIKAGLLGWLVFLPLGEMSLPGLGALVVGLGLIAAIGAAIIGICQCKAKTVLAYSSISQMGWMTMMVGLVLLEASMVSILLPLVALFALHHGLAKGALFLCVPMNVHRKWSWLWVLLPASSLMGLPFTSGALLKTEFKYFLDFQVAQHWIIVLLPLMLSIASIGTCLLMFRYYWCLSKQTLTDVMNSTQRASLILLSILSSVAFLGLPYLGFTVGNIYSLDGGVKLLYPLLLAGVITLLIISVPINTPKIPAGDLLIPIRFALLSAYHATAKFLSNGYDRYENKVSVWLKHKRAYFENLSPPEILETAMRRHVVWVFMCLAVSFALIVKL